MECFDFKPISIYKNNLNYEISDDQLNIIQNLQISNSLLSKEMHLLDNSAFEDLKKEILCNAEYYARQICSFPKEIKFRMTESWYRKTTYNQDHPMHNHPNSVLSGVYYISVPGGNNHDSINFFDDSSLFKNFQFHWTPVNYNKYNCNHLQIPVKRDTLIMFPSWINHYVTTNISPNISRQIISFNLFVEGIFDIENEYPTKLTL